MQRSRSMRINVPAQIVHGVFVDESEWAVTEAQRPWEDPRQTILSFPRQRLSRTLPLLLTRTPFASSTRVLQSRVSAIEGPAKGVCGSEYELKSWRPKRWGGHCAELVCSASRLGGLPELRLLRATLHHCWRSSWTRESTVHLVAWLERVVAAEIERTWGQRKEPQLPQTWAWHLGEHDTEQFCPFQEARAWLHRHRSPKHCDSRQCSSVHWNDERAWHVFYCSWHCLVWYHNVEIVLSERRIGESNPRVLGVQHYWARAERESGKTRVRLLWAVVTSSASACTEKWFSLSYLQNGFSLGRNSPRWRFK